MKYVILIVLPFVVYFGLGWLANEIYFSINEINGSTTMNQIYDGQIISTAFLMIIYNTVCEMIHEKSYSFILSFIVPFVITAIFVLMPMSVGAAVLCTILNIATMIAGGFYSFGK